MKPSEFKEPNQVDVDLLTSKSRFSKWRQALSRTSKRSLGHSIKIKTESSISNSKQCKFSFKSMFKYVPPCDDEGGDDFASEDSDSSQFHLQFDLDNFNSQDSHMAKLDQIRLKQMQKAFATLKDIPPISDRDPVVICKLEDNGLEFNVLDNINQHTYMRIFYKVHAIGIHHTLPNLY